MDLLPILAQRRSVRRFKPVPMPEDDLEKLLFALQRAPTDASAQLYSVIRVQDHGLRDQVARLSGDQEHIRQAAEFFVFLADVHRLERLLAHRGERMAFWPRTALHFALLDAGLAASYLALTAEALGYGVCFIGGVLNGVEELINLLELPRGVIPAVGLAVGVPDEEGPPRPRLPRSLVVHENRYRPYSPEDLEAAFQAMAPYSRVGDWGRVLRRYFAQGGTMEERETPYGRALARQGLDPDLPPGTPFYSLGALLAEALGEGRAVLFRKGEAWLERETEAFRGEGSPGEALLTALRKARGEMKDWP
ncbi:MULTISPECIES: nitroreductase family protein [Thermus]|uniref:Oxygen-insesitive NAD n=1 Tax=Thermus scotoductus (strain ATCC 700910 / SA-01) TaxID=743525 RepID=E8PJZ2_THESS|nr:MULTISPECIES: nitroreductase family protein [Thermus]ADW20844.1 oxygen-insesitive NAD [Thermus scotoductus SA-01]